MVFTPRSNLCLFLKVVSFVDALVVGNSLIFFRVFVVVGFCLLTNDDPPTVPLPDDKVLAFETSSLTDIVKAETPNEALPVDGTFFTISV